jgi:hypothetical protein
MLRVTIEMWPYGSEGDKHVITERLLIWNDGTGNINKGNYECCFGLDKYDIGNVPTKTVKGHVRLEGAWKLVYRCLRRYYVKR